MVAENSRSQGRINENYLFIQAFQLYQEAKKAEKANFIKALNLYKQALALIDSIPIKFPSSELALKIAQRKIRLGRSSYSSIRKRIAGLRRKAAREELLTILHDSAMNLQAPEMKADALGQLATEFWNNNQKEYARTIFAEALETVEAIENKRHRNHSLTQLAIRYAKIGEFERALTLSIYFSEVSDQIRLLTDLAVAYFAEKEREKARQLFNNAIELAERETDASKSIAVKAWIAFKLAESGEFFWALEVSDALEDSDSRSAILHEIAEKLIESGKLAVIQEIVNKVTEKEIKSELLANLVERYADEGYFSHAREFADLILITALKARAYLTIARKYKGEKLNKIGLELIEEAVKLADVVANIEDKVLILTLASGLCNEFHEVARAQELIQSVVTSLERLDDSLKRSELLTYVVEVSLEIGQKEQAREIIDKIEIESVRYRAITLYCAKFAALDKIEEAIGLARTIADETARIEAFFAIIKNNPENRNFKIKSDLVNEIIAAARATDGDSDKILADCTMLMAKFEKFHQALQLLEHIKGDEIRNQLLWNLSLFKFQTGFFVEGIEIIRLIIDANLRISRLIEVGLAILQNKYPDSNYQVEDFLPVAFSFWLEEKEKLDSAEV